MNDLKFAFRQLLKSPARHTPASVEYLPIPRASRCQRDRNLKFAALQMVDVHFPTTDGRELIFRRYTQPEKDQKILLAQLGWQLPEQPPPRISAQGELVEPAA